MEARRFSRQKTFLIPLITFLSTCLAQSPQTNTPVPPLQWIELTPHLSGSATPPPLKYASIGFDSTSRTLIVFGGESNGFPTQQTYLLNTTSLTWSTPVPPSGLTDKPPSRSAAISGQDFAASNRHGHVVIGGNGTNGTPLSDAWEFDYNNKFWSQINISPGGPSARYSATGGTDPLTMPVSDGAVPGPNNTFYLVGGFDGTSLQPLSDVWQFEVAGVLSSNLPHDTVGSWSQIHIKNDLPSRVRQGGTVMPSSLVIVTGGCGTADFDDNRCAEQDAHVVNIGALKDISPPNCPAPRVGPAVVPNYNGASSDFAIQSLIFLGTFDDTLWDDGGGLANGEVDIFNSESGVWTRILPAGDPGTDGKVKFPLPREGASAVSSPFAIVGSNPSVGSDTIVFGGQDAQGNYLNDVWLLRSYMGTITSTNGTWAGFGGGALQTGVDAAGQGVTVQYMTTCAKQLAPSPTSTSRSPSQPSPSPSNTSNNNNSPVSSIAFPFETSVSHKLLSPISIALLLAAIVFYRLSLPSVPQAEQRGGLLWLSGIVIVAAYAVGIAGVSLAFSTITSSSPQSSLTKRLSTSDNLLKTSHGKAGLAFFIGLYGILPFVLLGRTFSRKTSPPEIREPDPAEDAARKNSTDTGLTAFNGGREKKDSFPTIRSRQSSSPHEPDGLSTPESLTTEHRRRTRSWHLWPGFHSKEASGQSSNDNGPDSESPLPGQSQGFVVVNRGRGELARRLSTTGVVSNYSHPGRLSNTGRSLSDLSWLDRRRSLNVVGELDYALSQLNQAGRRVPTPGFDAQSTNPLIPQTPIPQPVPRPRLPSRLQLFIHTLFHAFLLGICVVALVALWQRAPKATFAVFLLWALAFYAIIFILAWRGRPRRSILTVLLFSLKEAHQSHATSNLQPNVSATGLPPTPPSSRPLSTMNEYAFPTEQRGPYLHQPLFRTALSSTHEDEYVSSQGHGDDEDEETQQRRIEQEMERREVSIVTVPKRKLWIANPS